MKGMMEMHNIAIVVFSVLLLCLLGCSSGIRPDPGPWNSDDAELVAENLISDALFATWYRDFATKNKEKPRVRLGEVTVRTNGETVSTAFFMKQIEDGLINSGKIRVIQSQKEANDTRKEIDDASKHSGNNTPDAGKENAADFILRGEMTVQDHMEGPREIRAYIVSLNLTHIQTGDKVWQKTEKIKKYIEKKNTKW